MKGYIIPVIAALSLSACSSLPFSGKDKQPPIKVGGMDVPSWFLSVLPQVRFIDASQTCA